MSRKIPLLLAILLTAGCSRLDTLTPELLEQASARWNTSRPEAYRLVVEMKGDRVEKEEFEVSVRSDRIEMLRRNGVGITPKVDQDYSMGGLFHILRLEMDLAATPALLGAPAGYSAYLMARFDPVTGRLLEYRRTVGGTSNTIEIKVLEFAAVP